jgi:fructokinase
MPDENTAEFVFYRNPGADMLLRAEELDATLLQRTKAFHFGSISLIAEPSRSATLEAVRLARQAGALISFDVNYRPSLWPKPEQAYDVIIKLLPQANLVKVNEVELELLSGSRDLEVGGSTLLQHGLDLCVVTMGPNGSFFKMAKGSQQVAAFPVSAVDAVGCGDAFTAGLLCRLVGNGSWRAKLDPAHLSEILRYANAVGALTARTQGVIPALPTAAQVDEFIGKQ